MKKESVTQLKEEFVSFEIAKLAKEKGFDEFCRKCFNEKGESEGFSGYAYMKEYNKNSTVHFIDTNSEEFEYPKIVCTQPTQSLLQMWLRKVHCIEVLPSFNDNNTYDYYYFIHTNISKANSNRICSLPKNYNSYEKALEAGLKEALKLIKS